MDNILDRIWQARIPLLRENKKPEAIYLGCEELRSLLGTLDGRLHSVFAPRGYTASCRNEVFGMPIYEVDAENHLRVV